VTSINVAFAEASVPLPIVTHPAPPPLGACHVAALVEVAVGIYHTAGVPVTVIPPILTESVALATALVICHPEILLFVRVSVEFLDTRVSLAPVGSVRIPPETVIAAILGVTRAGEPVLTSPPVPVELAPPRVSTIAQTVVSSRTVAAAAVMVMLASGIVIVFSVVVGQENLVNPLPVPP